MIIRQENKNDYEKVYNLVKLAFENATHSDGDEQNLVTRLRESEAFIPELSLVAEVEDEIVGHILFTKIKIGDSNTVGVALAPLAVKPQFQNRGIGGELIKEGHRIAKELGYGFSVVLGHDRYYPKFGYQPAKQYSIIAPFPVDDKNFMAVKLNDRIDSFHGGVVEYAKEFNIN